MQSSSVAAFPKAGRREWIGLAVIALPCLLYAMDLTVLNLALPRLSADLKPSSAQLLWIVDIYGFLVAGLLITMGTLGDRIGRRKLLLIGAAAFGAASILAAFSTSAEMLIAARALLGIAGATVAPSTLSLIRNMFLDPGQRTMAIGVWVTSFSVGGAIGPLLGGLLLEFFWWGSVFLLAVPVMVLLLLLGPLLLPEYRDLEAGRLDLISAALSLIAVLAMIYGLKEIAQAGLAWLPVLSILAGVVVGVAFARRQQRLADPLLDVRLFQSPAFSAALAAYTLSGFVVFGSLVFIAQYLQLVLGLSPLEAGAWTLPSSVGFIIGSMLAPRLARPARPGLVVVAGFLVAGAGLMVLTRTGVTSEPSLVAAGAFIISLGLAPVFTLATDLIISGAPPERAGAAAAISETGVEFGGALGIAVLGSVFIAVYRRAMAGSVLADVPPDAAQAARDTLGGALATAEGLPAALGQPLLNAAREAFTQAMHLAAVICIVVAVAAAVMAAILLRDVQPAVEPEQDPMTAEPPHAS